MFQCNDRVRVIQSENTLLSEHTEDVGRLGFVLAVDHPAGGIAGSLTVVLNPYHDDLEAKVHRALRFLNHTQIELV